MKGVVFNLLEQVVVKKYGETTWDDLLDATALSGAYTTLGSYPDEEIEKLVAAPSDHAGRAAIGSAALVRAGSHVPLLASHYPRVFLAAQKRAVFCDERHQHHSSRSAQILCLGRAARIFRFETTAPDYGALLMGAINSARKLCALAHGFIEERAPATIMARSWR